jgi:hypothetical protein
MKIALFVLVYLAIGIVVAAAAERFIPEPAPGSQQKRIRPLTPDAERMAVGFTVAIWPLLAALFVPIGAMWMLGHLAKKVARK